MVANDAEVSPEANAEVASRVIRILSEDVYFADASLVAENIQTIGYMKMVRANLELLQTGDQAHHISFMGSWDGWDWVWVWVIGLGTGIGFGTYTVG